MIFDNHGYWENLELSLTKVKPLQVFFFFSSLSLSSYLIYIYFQCLHWCDWSQCWIHWVHKESTRGNILSGELWLESFLSLPIYPDSSYRMLLVLGSDVSLCTILLTSTCMFTFSGPLSTHLGEMTPQLMELHCLKRELEIPRSVHYLPSCWPIANNWIQVYKIQLSCLQFEKFRRHFVHPVF